MCQRFSTKAAFCDKIRNILIIASAPDAIMGGGHFSDGGAFARRLFAKQASVEFIALPVEQNVQMALAVSDYACALADGRVEPAGPSRQAARNAHVRQAYLGI